MQPKSEAGATDATQYRPTWEYYSDLLFLVDHIKPRKTYSNISSSTTCMKTILSFEEKEDEEKENILLYTMQRLSPKTVYWNAALRTTGDPETTQDSLDAYDVMTDSNISYEESIAGTSVASDTRHDTSASIRQEVTLKRENKVPSNDTM